MMVSLLIVFVLLSVAELSLSWMNLRHLKRHGAEIPFGFDGLDPVTLKKTADYTVDSNRLGLLESLAGITVTILFLFAGILGLYDQWISARSDSFILRGVLFFLPLFLAQTLLDIPFSLYRNFSLESRYGFNTMTPKLWLTDLFKSMAIGVTLVSILIAGSYGLVLLAPHSWWLWVWGFFAVISLFLLYLSPYVIEPLFFRFEPVKKEGLEQEIRMMMEKAGLHVSRVLQMDASRRSRHSNAYFTGIGRVKRIVLFDTLLEKLDGREILAVLAHEAGHWKRHHLPKRLLLAESIALIACCGAFHLLGSDRLPSLLGMKTASFSAQLVILGFLFSLVSSLVSPLSNWLSRKHEYQADRYAVELSRTPEALASALVTLSRDNLSNLHPHPLYAAIYYSHPPVVERVQKLLSSQKGKSPDLKPEPGLLRSSRQADKQSSTNNFTVR